MTTTKPNREFVQDRDGNWWVIFGTAESAEARFIGPKKPKDVE